MEEPGRLTLIGTGHVLDIGDAVRGAIEAVRPDWVFVELDRGRLHALMQRRAGKPAPTGGPWIHRKLQAFQEQIASSYGTQAGDEMLAAVDGAHLVGAKVGLVDRPIQQTFQRVKKELTWREKGRGVGMLIGAGFRGLLPAKTSTKDSIDAQLAAYAEDPEAALDEMAGTFPTVRRVVIDERDAWMAQRILQALSMGGTGVAVVGDGHVPGMTRLLDGLELDVYRLPDVRAGRLPKPDPNSTNSASFAFDVA